GDVSTMKSNFIVASLFIASWSQAATYYVAKTGSGSTCSQAAPCSTIAAALAMLSAGDTLIIGDGTYTEGIYDEVPSGIDDAHHTVVMAAPGAHVIVNGCNSDSIVWAIFGKSYITLDGLDLDAASCSGAALTVGAPENIVGSPPSSYILIQNNTIRDAFVYT